MNLTPTALQLYNTLGNMGLPIDVGQDLQEMLIRALNEETEACAESVKNLDAWTGGHGEPSKPGSSAYMETIRKRKIRWMMVGIVKPP